MKLFRKFVLMAALASIFLPIAAQAYTTTTHYSFQKPASDDPTDQDQWGAELNANLDSLDSLMFSALGFVTSAKTANYTVTTSDYKKLFLVDDTSGNVTLALPSAATAGNGFTIAAKKTVASANTVTLQGNSTDTIDGSNTYTLSAQYAYILITSNGTSWQILSSTPAAVSAATTSAAGIVQLATSAVTKTGTDATKALTPGGMAGNSSLGSSGYYALPGGLIIEWGTYAGGANSPTITFPLAFSTALYSIEITSSGGQAAVGYITSSSLTTFVNHQTSVSGAAATSSFYWMALGK